MGEVVPFAVAGRRAAGEGDGDGRLAPSTVYQDHGWRVLELPQAGQFVALSAYCRGGIEIGRFDPESAAGTHHGGSDVAILTRCGTDESLSRCAIGWLNADGPRTAILGAFVVAAGGRYKFWRDAILERAAIGGRRLVRLSDGRIVDSGAPEPVTLLDPFAAVAAHRRRAAFGGLPPEVQQSVLQWADPAHEFRTRLDD
jgi:hypothetical protein